MKRSGFVAASRWRNFPARTLRALKRLNLRIAQASSVRLTYRSMGASAEGAYRPYYAIHPRRSGLIFRAMSAIDNCV